MVTDLDPMTLAAAMVLEDGRRWGSVGAQFQLDDLRAVFSTIGALWHFLTRPRGGSKSSDLAIFLLVWLVCLARPSERGYIVASDADQGGFAVLDAIVGLVARTPILQGRVTIQAAKIIGANGATVEVLTADGASTWGLRPSIIVTDEIAAWPQTRNARAVWAALISSTGKMPGCRLICLTSAGEPSHWSYGVLKAARADSERWRVNEVPGPLPWADRANLEAQRPLLRESEFARLHLNIWTEAEDRLVTAEDLDACAILDPEHPLDPNPSRRYIISLDLGLTFDRTVACVAHQEIVPPEESEEPSPVRRRVVVDWLQTWSGTKAKPVDLTEVEAWLEATSKRYNGARLIADPWQAAGLCQRLRARNISVEEFPFSSASVGRIASGLYLALRSHSIWLPNDEDLRDELGRVRLRETTPGVVRLDHDAGAHDDRAVACGLAVVALLDRADGRFEIMFDPSTPEVAIDGQPLQNLNGAFAMSPEDSFGAALGRMGDAGW